MKTFTRCLLLLGFFYSSMLHADTDISLPKRHTLLQNEKGEYLLKNRDGIIMVDPSILAIGHTDKWILACSKNESIDTDLKRYFFINLKTGGTTDSINQENWEYYLSVYPELADIPLQALVDEPCPK